MPLQPDVSDLTADVALGATPFTIFRYQYNWVGGEYIRSGVRRINALGIVRPITTMYNSTRYGAMETYIYEPEGYIEDYSIKIASKSVIKLRDEIIWDGKRFTVTAARRWDAYGFCDAVCKLLNEDTGEYTGLDSGTKTGAETGGDADA